MGNAGPQISSDPESKADAEALISQFQLNRILNQDQNGRRITLLGTISSQQGLLTLERAAFPSSTQQLSTLLSRITPKNLGANDIYRWYMAHISPSPSPTPTSDEASSIPDLKVNLIFPCTPSHIRKYSSQRLRYVTESPTIYRKHVHPYILTQRESGRLDWIFNILDGRTEQEDVILRSDWDRPDDSGFLLLPDLNWDRKTVTGLHLLALVQRRDIWSLRDLKKEHVPWLKGLRDKVVTAAASVFEGEVEEDDLKCYVHYHPTYYHFHIHVVHVMLEPEGGTQSVGKAWLLGGLIAWLESMGGDEEVGLDTVEMTYGIGEESELWKGLWGKIKAGEAVTFNERG
jgi:m7GpppX diphosphatase